MDKIPPAFRFNGDKGKARSLSSKALQFYNFTIKQMEAGGVSFIHRSLPLPDGSRIAVTAKKEDIYKKVSGSIKIYGVEEAIKSVKAYGFISVPDISIPTTLNIYEKGYAEPPTPHPSFNAGVNYWYGPGDPGREKKGGVISWYGKFIYIGGAYAQLSPNIVCAARRENGNILIVTSNSLQEYTATVSSDIISVSFDNSVSLNLVSFKTVVEGGFSSDLSTLYLRYADTSSQTILRLSIAPDLTIVKNDTIITGTIPTSVYTYSSGQTGVPADYTNTNSFNLTSVNTSLSYISNIIVKENRAFIIRHKMSSNSYTSNSTSHAVYSYDPVTFIQTQTITYTGSLSASHNSTTIIEEIVYDPVTESVSLLTVKELINTWTKSEASSVLVINTTDTHSSTSSATISGTCPVSEITSFYVPIYISEEGIVFCEKHSFNRSYTLKEETKNTTGMSAVDIAELQGMSSYSSIIVSILGDSENILDTKQTSDSLSNFGMGIHTTKDIPPIGSVASGSNYIYTKLEAGPNNSYCDGEPYLASGASFMGNPNPINRKTASSDGIQALICCSLYTPTGTPKDTSLFIKNNSSGTTFNQFDYRLDVPDITPDLSFKGRLAACVSQTQPL